MGPLTQPLTGDQRPLIQKWVKWLGDGEKFLGLLYLDGTACAMIPKPSGEVLTQATIRLREYEKS